MTIHDDAKRIIEKAFERSGGDLAIVDQWLNRRIPTLGGQSTHGERFRALCQVGFVCATATNLGRIYVFEPDNFSAAFDRIAINDNTGERGGNDLLQHRCYLFFRGRPRRGRA